MFFFKGQRVKGPFSAVPAHVLLHQQNSGGNTYSTKSLLTKFFKHRFFCLFH
uniref:Uncharacterized protein n=1 Tax=Anguilla anguilla TaxID=7936 RepID=A0A0E9SY57_ANGAN